jgi:hypothetical protein
MSAANPISLLYSGRAGDYFGSNYAGLPSDVAASIDRSGKLLTSRGLSYLGMLTCSQFAQIEVYVYATTDRKVAVSLMATRSDLGGIDCVSKFADNSFLTTTTVRVVPGAYDAQQLFRFSHPQLNTVELLAEHLTTIDRFESRCGKVQAINADLCSIARTIDEYSVRQKSNDGHGFIKYAGGFAHLISKFFSNR